MKKWDEKEIKFKFVMKKWFMVIEEYEFGNMKIE